MALALIPQVRRNEANLERLAQGHQLINGKIRDKGRHAGFRTEAGLHVCVYCTQQETC